MTALNSQEADDARVAELETLHDSMLLNNTWDKLLSPIVLQYVSPHFDEERPFYLQLLTKRQLSQYRKYDYSSVRDLLRYNTPTPELRLTCSVIRNKAHHWHQEPLEFQEAIGKGSI